ncbi:mRNA 3'-end-processing protein YTH1 [Sphaceloma murrayae]|uniref:mRNA 3'-end-processing protein n=1 Tax=Sphaceloma murrayae TaxID=2082308 RepID=A0A2K1QYT1_9PEZI|nr:mRNA 3'-end-processing protein YTH1 [Sphaceloma murrayae]
MSTTETQTLLADQIIDPSIQSAPELSFLPYLKATYSFGYPSKVHRPICEPYRKGQCPYGPACPDQHYTPANERSGIGHLICKHYQRGLCKKGETCEFAHTFDLRGERECKEFSRFGICPQGDECTYIHLPPTSPLRLPACPHYARGFCQLGPYCSMRHVKHDKICSLYISGFCPNGRAGPPGKDGVILCENGAHPKWVPEAELKKPEVKIFKTEEQLRREQEEREDEFYAEEEKRRERFERGEGGVGRGWGRRRRGRGGAWRGRGG